MMPNVWLESPQQKLKIWRKFRKELININDEEVLQSVVDWWKSAPINSRVIDPYDNTDWPNPWDLLYTGDYDENVIALGMAYTLELIEWPCEVKLIQDRNKSEVKLIILVDDEYILNYTYGIINKLADISHCDILKSWDTEQLT